MATQTHQPEVVINSTDIVQVLQWHAIQHNLTLGAKVISFPHNRYGVSINVLPYRAANTDHPYTISYDNVPIQFALMSIIEVVEDLSKHLIEYNGDWNRSIGLD
jgi:hypothetical protein